MGTVTGADIYNSFYSGNIAAGVQGNNFGNLSRFLNPQINSSYWPGEICTGNGACTNNGTAVPSLATFKDMTQSPMNTWDYTGSTADGPEDHWTKVTDPYPQSWRHRWNRCLDQYFNIFLCCICRCYWICSRRDRWHGQ